MTEKLMERLRQSLERKLSSMTAEMRQAERARSETALKKRLARMALRETYNLLQRTAPEIGMTIETKLAERGFRFDRTGDESFTLSLGPVEASVEVKDDHLEATITRGDPPEETRRLSFQAIIRDGALFLTRAESPISIYPDDVLGDILEAVIEMVE